MRLVCLVLLFSTAMAFVAKGNASPTRVSALNMGYVPDGISKEQWEKIKQKESAKKVGSSQFTCSAPPPRDACYILRASPHINDPKIGKFDGLSGAKFRSRSMEDYQKGREAGKLKPNMVRMVFVFALTYTSGVILSSAPGALLSGRNLNGTKERFHTNHPYF